MCIINHNTAIINAGVVLVYYNHYMTLLREYKFDN